jgi:glucose-6-phosphate dehydrogenase assembly protein OpcA
VIDGLTALRHAAPRTATRTSVMTLVVVSTTDDDAYRSQQAMRALGGHHPARLVVLRPEPDGRPPGIDADATLFTGESTEHVFVFDEVGLVVRGEAALHLDSIIEPFTLSDLPVVVWYPGPLPAREDPLLAVADTVLVDSKEAGDTSVFAALAELAPGRAFVDLSWERLRPWRELLAGLFDGAAYRPFVTGIATVEVDGKPGPRHLLGGWLASRLGITRSQVHLTDARHVRIVLHAAYDGATAVFEVSRADGERVVNASATITGGPHHRELVALPEDSLAWSLARALTHLSRDRVWEDALAAAVVLGP